MPDMPAIAIREEFVEVGRFTGAAGGRIKVTKELYDWIAGNKDKKIVGRQYIVRKRLLDQAQRQNIPASKITQELVVNEIRKDLHDGAYNNEPIDLSYWTVRYIIDGRYLPRLKKGGPKTEWMLEKQQGYRDTYNALREKELQATREERARWREIAIVGNFNRDILVAAGRARSRAEIIEMFPMVTWPEDWTLEQIKTDIQDGSTMSPYKIRGRKPGTGRRQRGRMTEYTERTEVPGEESFEE